MDKRPIIEHCEDEMKSWRTCSPQEGGKVSITGRRREHDFPSFWTTPESSSWISPGVWVSFALTTQKRKKDQHLHFPLVWCSNIASPAPPPPQSREAPSLSPEDVRFNTPRQSSHHAVVTWTTHPQLANIDHFQQKMKHEVCKNNELFTDIPGAATR